MPRVPPRSGGIKKGEVRNPKGCSAKVRALSKVRRMTGADLADLTSLLLTGNLDQLVGIRNSQDATIMQRLTAKLLLDCWAKSDISIYRAILDRVVGRPKESQSIEISGPDAGPVKIAQLSEQEIERQLAEIEARNAKTRGADRA